jgi:hypothetical protein
MEMMTRFLAGVLSVIAVGVMLIAYGLLSAPAAGFESRMDANQAYPWLAGQPAGPQAGPYQSGYQPAFASQGYTPQGYQPQFVYVDRNAPPAAYYGYPAYAAQAPAAAPAPVYFEPRPVRTTTVTTAAQPTTSRVIQRAPQRDWKKTALVVGGTTATGAGVGAIFGGKKGALIGAAIGGGASTIYEATKR